MLSWGKRRKLTTEYQTRGDGRMSGRSSRGHKSSEKLLSLQSKRMLSLFNSHKGNKILIQVNLRPVVECRRGLAIMFTLIRTPSKPYPAFLVNHFPVWTSGRTWQKERKTVLLSHPALCPFLRDGPNARGFRLPLRLYTFSICPMVQWLRWTMQPSESPSKRCLFVLVPHQSQSSCSALPCKVNVVYPFPPSLMMMMMVPAGLAGTIAGARVSGRVKKHAWSNIISSQILASTMDRLPQLWWDVVLQVKDR